MEPEELDRLHEKLAGELQDPGVTAQADQVRTAAHELGYSDVFMALMARKATADGDLGLERRYAMARALTLRTTNVAVLASALICQSELVAEVLVQLWGSLEKVLESLDDETAPLFPGTDIGLPGDGDLVLWDALKERE